jgi:hypothetical protein
VSMSVLKSNMDADCRFESFTGSAIFNLLAFAPPAVYSTLSKLWVAKLSSSEVVTTDVYTYIGIIVEVMNDGIPRSAG